MRYWVGITDHEWYRFLASQPELNSDRRLLASRSMLRVHRFGWLPAAVGTTVFATYEVVVHDLWPGPLLVIALLPELALVVEGWADGRDPLRRRAASVYAVVHEPIVPLAVMALAVASLLVARVLNESPAAFESARRIPLYCYTAGTVWFAHIAFERAFGFSVGRSG